MAIGHDLRFVFLKNLKKEDSMVFLQAMKQLILICLFYFLCFSNSLFAQREAYISIQKDKAEVHILYDVVSDSRTIYVKLPENIEGEPQAFFRQLRLREEIKIEKKGLEYKIDIPEECNGKFRQIDLRYTLSLQALDAYAFREDARICLFWSNNEVLSEIAAQKPNNSLFFLPENWQPKYLSLQLPNFGEYIGTKPNVVVDADHTRLISFENISDDFEFCWHNPLHPSEEEREKIASTHIQPSILHRPFPKVFAFSKPPHFSLKQPYFEENNHSSITENTILASVIVDDSQINFQEIDNSILEKSEAHSNIEEIFEEKTLNDSPLEHDESKNYDQILVAFNLTYPRLIYGFFTQITEEDYLFISTAENTIEQFRRAKERSNTTIGEAESEVLYRNAIDQGLFTKADPVKIQVGYDRQQRRITLSADSKIESEIVLRVATLRADTIISIVNDKPVLISSEMPAEYVLPLKAEQPIFLQQSDAQAWKLFYAEDGPLVRYWSYRQLLHSTSPYVRAAAASLALDDEIEYFRSYGLATAEGIPMFAKERIKEGLQRMLEEGNIDQMQRASHLLNKLFHISSEAPSFPYTSPNRLANRLNLYSHWISRYAAQEDTVKEEIINEIKQHEEIKEDLSLFYFFLTGLGVH
jgi:hypothetical protein